ncbi:MAG: hypothetical protein D6722_19155 [Bacteroidetes bacterium]|nr:MAG: hypothetical protein D6722_19155 [Bacteroidota bacterium]
MHVLWELVGSLSAPEQKGFAKHLQDTFSRRPSLEQDLFRLIQTGKSPADVEAELFPERVRGKASRRTGAFRKLCSQLKRRLEGFVLQQHLDAHPLDRQFLLLPCIVERGLSGLLPRELSRTQTLLEAEPGWDPRMFWRQYKLTRLDHNHRIQQNLPPAEPGPLFDSFDHFWAMEKLQHLLVWLHRPRTSDDTDPPPRLHPELMALTAPGGDLGAHPGIALLHAACAQQSGRPIMPATHLGLLFMRQARRFSDELQNLLFATLVHTYLRQLHADTSPTHQAQAYLWYRFGLRRGYLYRHGELLPVHYKNLIGLAIHLRRFEMAAHYLETLSPDLPESERESLPILMRAIMHFEQGQKREVLRLRIHTLNRPSDEISVRFFLIKAAYDLGETETIDRDMETIRMRLTRAKNLSPTLLRLLRRRLKHMRQFLKAKTPAQRRALRAQLQAQPSPDTPWMLGHLEAG